MKKVRGGGEWRWPASACERKSTLERKTMNRDEGKQKEIKERKSFARLDGGAESVLGRCWGWKWS